MMGPFMLTVLGNIRINSQARLKHLKDSLATFKGESDNWLINVRGTLRDEAITFLRRELGDRLVLFELLDDSRGWITNSLEMLKEAQYEYVLIWLEDHLNLAAPGTLGNVVEEMQAAQVDYLPYSWWMFGRSRKSFDELHTTLGLTNKECISYLTLTKEKWREVRNRGHKYFLISMLGIFRKDFLREMWRKDQKRWPLFFKKGIFKLLGALTKVGFSTQGHKEIFSRINRFVFFNKLRKYPPETPFEMEKDQERVDILPFVLALPRQELFACIDDDLNETGYSLIDRGLYVETEPVSHSY
jgi:hypothetical protein